MGGWKGILELIMMFCIVSSQFLMLAFDFLVNFCDLCHKFSMLFWLVIDHLTAFFA